jgi:catechol 2,3-dioxygenase-like lactoylglutathione lyase family enzyme
MRSRSAKADRAMNAWDGRSNATHGPSQVRPMAIAHVDLAVRDVQRSSRFFANALGWRPIRRPGNVPRPAAWLEIAPGQELHLVEASGFEPSPFSRRGRWLPGSHQPLPVRAVGRTHERRGRRARLVAPPAARAGAAGERPRPPHGRGPEAGPGRPRGRADVDLPPPPRGPDHPSVSARGRTVASLIAEPGAGRLQVSPGNPCEAVYTAYHLD